jgi:hAT family C-terminal dimerisation region
MAALDYLAIQGSAVPCERVFSSAKETMTDRRNRIHEGLMEMLQMLKFSLKSGRQLDFSKDTSREDVIAYLESVLEAETTIPEDITAFIQSLLSTVQ